jgi:hypothetical protein
MWKSLVLAILTLSFPGCGAREPKGFNTYSYCGGKIGDKRFLPESLAYEGDGLGGSSLAAILRASGEPSLMCGPPTKALRFIWVRTFHSPVILSVTLDDERPTIRSYEFEGMGGYPRDAEKIIRHSVKVLSAPEIRTIRDAIHWSRVWMRPLEDGREGLDGSQWIFEVRDGENYNITKTWMPSRGGLRDLGYLLIEYSGLTFVREDIY